MVLELPTIRLWGKKLGDDPDDMIMMAQMETRPRYRSCQGFSKALISGNLLDGLAALHNIAECHPTARGKAKTLQALVIEALQGQKATASVAHYQNRTDDLIIAVY